MRTPISAPQEPRCQNPVELLHFRTVQDNLFARWQRAHALTTEFLLIASREIPLHFVHNAQARRYILRIQRDGAVRVTIPRGGSECFALEFARTSSRWVERQLQKRSSEAERPKAWSDGSEIIFRGDPVKLVVRTEGETQLVAFADQALAVAAKVTDLRRSVENHLWSLAAKELPPRTGELAAQHQLTYRRVVVRSQRSRWGSCSPAKTISLNWRLIQAPRFVCDYLIIHELMHLREMNHSLRFWALVRAACPGYDRAEAWLNQHSHLLRSPF
jgi:predicted metal-dependent hydrolase